MLCLITLEEIRIIRELLLELCSIADQGECFEDEVEEVLDILESLKKYDSDLFFQFIKDQQQGI